MAHRPRQYKKNEEKSRSLTAIRKRRDRVLDDTLRSARVRHPVVLLLRCDFSSAVFAEFSSSPATRRKQWHNQSCEETSKNRTLEKHKGAAPRRTLALRFFVGDICKILTATRHLRRWEYLLVCFSQRLRGWANVWRASGAGMARGREGREISSRTARWGGGLLP